MNRSHLAIAASVAAISLGFATAQSAMARKTATAASPSADNKMISSAMQAAPAKVAAGAAIIEMKADGSMRTLRPGNNGFTCMADNPSTPGPDPMCLDKASMAWVHALSMKKPPPAGKVGFMYMLAGGTDASNTDPWATRPTRDNHWVKTGPHVMIVGADAAFYDSYPKGADPDTREPYVMWAGTPYQHLMVPVK